MASNIKVSTMRGPNAVAAHPEIRKSDDGKRRAYGRNVKRSLPDHRFDVVRVWTLKKHTVTAGWITLASGVGPELVDKFLKTGEYR